MLARLLPRSPVTIWEGGRKIGGGRIIILAGVLGLVALLLVGSAGAFPPERPMAQGGAPTLISYQGQLTDPGTGEPVADADYDITFAIYDVESGSSPLWSETQLVSVSEGLFNVLLGSVNPLSASDFSGPDRWLEVQVETDLPMTPRQRIASVPYALNADTVDGQDASAFAQATHSHSSLDAADGSPTHAIYVDNEGGVGIGTTDPGTNRLKVAGDTEITGELNIAEGAIQDGRIISADIKDNAVGFPQLNLVLVASSDGVLIPPEAYSDFLIEATYDLDGTYYPIYFVSVNRWRDANWLGQEFSYALIHKVEEDYWNTKWYLRIKNESDTYGGIRYRVWRLQ